MRRSTTVQHLIATALAAIIATLLALSLGATAATAATTAAITTPASCVPDTSTGCVMGTLRDSDGNAVKNVGISLTGTTGAAVSTKTNADGQYRFAVTETGTYTVKLDTATLPGSLKATVAEKTVTVDVGNLSAVIFPLKGTSSSGESATDVGSTGWTYVWNTVALGVLLGLMLGLASIGVSLVYGTTGLSNFAHAEQVTLGGMLVYVFGIVLGLPFLVAAVISVVLCALTGLVQDRLLWQPLRRRGLGLTQLMVVTIGLQLALEYIYQYFFGAAPLPVTNTIQENTGPLNITPNAYWSMLISVVVLIAVGLALQRTRIGRATRAVSDNRALAAASGIDVDFIIRIVWTVATGLAGLAGILYALVYGGISWNTGAILLLLIFAAVTLGGLGTAFGAMFGAMVIGLITQISSLWLSGDLRYATALLILILVLLFRPQGILGRRERVG